MLMGKAKDAMQFYQKAIGGELQMVTFGQMDSSCPAGIKDQIMHASLKFGDFVLMGSDGNPEEPEDAKRTGGAVQLSIGAPDAEITRLFGALSQGGQIIHNLFDAPWGGKFGVLIDRYGFQWMFASSDGA
jgi:PhnB protein